MDFLNVSGDSNDNNEPESMNASTSSSREHDQNQIQAIQPCESDTDSDSDDDTIDYFERVNARARAHYVNDDDEANHDVFVVHELPIHVLANMNRIDCSAHKLEKLGRKDAAKAEGLDPEYDDLHERVFVKLQAIWKLKDSRLNAEVFFRKTGRKVVGPHRIRWLKTHEAVSLTSFV